VNAFQRIGAVVALGLTLGACATITPVPAGPMAVKNEYSVTLGRMWSDVSPILVGRSKKVRVLSIDGPFLNRLYVTEGLVPGEGLVRSTVKERPTPMIRSGMSANERMEFVADSIAAMEYQRVEASAPRPAKFGSANAIRFDIEAKTPEGLDMKGTALVAEAAGKVYVILYLAPAEHYFAATLGEVESVMASVSL